MNGRAPRNAGAFVALVVGVLLVSGGCAQTPATRAGAAGSAPTTRSGGFPVVLRPADGPLVLARIPERIVSLSPTATEMLFAVGAGRQVVAVDSDSNYPTGAPRTKLSGFQPNTESVAAYRPDLVIVSNDVGNVVKSLQALSIPVALEPAAQSLADTYQQIEQIGLATGHGGNADRLVNTMKSEISAIVGSAPKFHRAVDYYYELDNTYYSVTSRTFVGQVLGLLGLHDIADRAKGAGSGYPQLSGEYVVKSDPQVMFLADTKCCGQSATTVAKRPGWNKITAVRTGAVVPLDDDIASRWGPRVVDLLRTVAQALRRLQPKLQGQG